MSTLLILILMSNVLIICSLGLPLHAYAIRARPSGWTSTQAPARNGKANKEAGKDADAASEAEEGEVV